MLWVIPIGGKGTRTQSLGEFKPFIKIKGYKMLLWFLFSIEKNISPNDSFVFITNEYFLNKFNVETEIRRMFKTLNLSNSIIVSATLQTMPGISAVLYASQKILKTNEPIIVICPDQFIDFEIPKTILSKTGYLTIALSFDKGKSTVDIQEGLIKYFVEKESISYFASNGVFIASSGNALLKAVKKQIKDKYISCNGEYCLGPAFNYLIKEGYKIYPLLTHARYSLGDITNINHFVNSPISQSITGTLAQLENDKAGAKLSQLRSYNFLTSFSF